MIACRGVRLWVFIGAVCVASSVACAQQPDLHGTGANPTTIATGEKRAAEVKVRSGSEWTLHLSDGSTLRYRLKPGEGEPGVAVFADDKGHEMKILVADDATVLFIPAEGGCYRTGKLVNGRVSNGTSGQACTPGGSWNAEMQ